MAARVRPLFLNKELVDIFMGTLQGLYFEKMVSSMSSNFSNMVTIGKHIENGLKTGNIVGIVNQQAVAKKPQGSFAKKKEWEASVIMENVHTQFQASLALMPY